MTRPSQMLKNRRSQAQVEVILVRRAEAKGRAGSASENTNLLEEVKTDDLVDERRPEEVRRINRRGGVDGELARTQRANVASAEATTSETK